LIGFADAKGGDYLYGVDDLLNKLSEIECLILRYTNPDGSCSFDAERVYMSLEIALRALSSGTKA